ncbi:MAG: MaoC family dehydratase [Candidatus Dormibacteraeota bacterium]|nr:MaoC family dehydratase [Candidatus Dormibacteraeota bacterium]
MTTAPGGAEDRRDAERARFRAAFDAIPPGATYSWRRTFTDGDVTAFCGVTGDLNPYHLDQEFAARSRFGRRIVPGLLTGSMCTHIGGLLGMLASEMRFDYLAPVFVGDTVTCTVRFTGREEARLRLWGDVSCVNQDGREVLRGSFSGVPSLVRLR